MSEENLEIVRRVYGARGDPEAVVAYYDPDVEFNASRLPFGRLIGGPGVYRGHDGLRRFFREYYSAWSQIEDEYEELIDAGESVVSVVRARGRGRRSGVEVEASSAAVWTIRDGKIVRVDWFSDRAEALEAAGLLA